MKRLIRPTDGYCFVTAGWRREASYPAYGGYCFVTAGWRREASYPAYGGYCFVTAGWRREASYPAYGRVLFCDCRIATRSILSGLRTGTVL
ncbi:TPA: hypothetical protein ACIAQR_000236 [Salmonella enterica subsp. enterica serovar Orion]|nr:hypothetical protein [Salmonella enterica]HEC7055664.1 hypothetical protein [Salmonella enterica subsp. enterica serovar Orion]EHK2724758.1 hypothetical protein [Salmonella enterica]EHK2729627.1 hypothetical protein [Salmonella enterica]HEC7818599.1 hypothetical protein [Salmonella enterica subsp. enterica serovar Orion]